MATNAFSYRVVQWTNWHAEVIVVHGFCEEHGFEVGRRCWPLKGLNKEYMRKLIRLRGCIFGDIFNFFKVL